MQGAILSAILSLILAAGTFAAFAHGPTATDSTAAGAGAGQLRIYIDPATGKPGEPPVAQQRRPPAEPANPAVSTSHEGLRMRQGATRAGGILLDLGGRFQDELRIEQGPQGSKLSCDQAGTTEASP